MLGSYDLMKCLKHPPRLEAEAGKPPACISEAAFSEASPNRATCVRRKYKNLVASVGNYNGVLNIPHWFLKDSDDGC